MNKENEQQENHKDLPQKDNIGKSISITKFKDLEGKFLHVKVGNHERPATMENILEVQDRLVKLFEENKVNCLVFVSHHAVSMDIVEKDN